MKLKYAEGQTPIRNEHGGYTFQPFKQGQSAMEGQKNDRFRRPAQWMRQHNNQKAVTNWRNMSPAVKAAWQTFAETFPQPSAANPDVFLTGYQCFVKRNSMCFLNHGINSDFMYEPELMVPDSDEITFELKYSETAIDCTENYIKRFGLIPAVGQMVHFYAAVYAEKTGHFYPSYSGQLIVKEVFIDGLFCSVQIPDTFENVTVSVYLSKPYSPGQKYVGSKVRYMGCFTKKKFTELTDVPPVTSADAGKVWQVDINGLWVVAPVSGGGGGNAFNPIISAGSSNITADQAAEPLTLIGEGGLEITLNNTAKSATFKIPDYSSIRGQANNSYAYASSWSVNVMYPTETASYCLRKFVLAGWSAAYGAFVIEGYIIRTGSSPAVTYKVIYDTYGWGVTVTYYSTYAKVVGNYPGGERFRQAMHYYHSGTYQ